LDSKLIKLEREISLITNQNQGRTGRGKTSRRGLKLDQLTRIKIGQTAKQKFAAFVAFCRVRGTSIVTQFQKLTDLVIREVSFPAKPTHRRRIAKPSLTPKRVRPDFLERIRPEFPKHSRPVPKRVRSERTKIGAQAPIWICFGLVSVCGVVCLTLLVQMRSLKHDVTDVSHEFAAIKLSVQRLEKRDREVSDIQSTSVPKNTAKTTPTPRPLSLHDADIHVIRQFIRVAPPPPDSQPKISVGDSSAGIKATPVPQSLADALPQLRGAKFSIDQSGAIILIAAGSGRVDAVVAYR
jgi:hypothetical protein